jgi:glycerol kinase
VVYLAGIAAGLWTIGELNGKWRIDRLFQGTLPPQEIESLKHQWLKAVARAKNWAD